MKLENGNEIKTINTSENIRGKRALLNPYDDAMSEIEPCPFCGGEARIAVCDDEGNIHNESEYEQNPWSGLGYQIVHSVEENKDCPIAKYGEDDAIMGIFIFDTREEAIAKWNHRV